MTTPESIPRAAPRLHTAIGRGLVALGALVAVAVTVLFLALTGANRTNQTGFVTATQSSTAYLPPIRYHGTGTPPTMHPHHPALTRPARGDYVRDPTTHALLRIPSADAGDPTHIRHEPTYGAAP
ncbi:MAG: hypothetical protein JO304_06945 [Solirubrobacterales bacterium]|nr:hypothetical protein [Solirubrobacterales bacterium]MBV9310625.1 hypothetical protein [Solirubrobacterales bacterium]